MSPLLPYRREHSNKYSTFWWCSISVSVGGCTVDELQVVDHSRFCFTHIGPLLYNISLCFPPSGQYEVLPYCDLYVPVG